MNIDGNSIRRADRAAPLESQEKFEAQIELLHATHLLRHAQGNACAFTLKAQLAKTADERRDCEGCVLYWDRIAGQHGVRVLELNGIINHHD